MSTALGWQLIAKPSVPAAPASIEYLATDIVGQTNSSFTEGEQIYRWAFGYWRWSISMPLLTESQAEQWIGFMMALQGAANVCLQGDPRRQNPQGTISGTPVVNGGGQTGFVLSLRGLTPSSTLIAGDYISIGFRLYRVTANATADGSGNMATLGLWPNLRESPSDGTAIVYTNTQGLFRLDTSERKWKIDGQRYYSLTYELKEVINQA